MAQIDVIPAKLVKKFIGKAAHRASIQASKGVKSDIVPMEELRWLNTDALYRGANASSNGLHVGVAGGWPHHSRLLAATFATELSLGLGLATDSPESSEYIDPDFAAERLAWLNKGQNAGDNNPEDVAERVAHFGFTYRFLSPELQDAPADV